ncbi:unnamed protein product [Sphenostylis stenocarpa]|uniref:Uncharacterized protein n=1 Tax=Sphenostylis stenocarpa TaxID=92480 RepID=A0AA86T625_9FABA|nr:unnamed protein product [Sphenostylis stenocarpa]
MKYRPFQKSKRVKGPMQEVVVGPDCLILSPAPHNHSTPDMRTSPSLTPPPALHVHPTVISLTQQMSHGIRNKHNCHMAL